MKITNGKKIIITGKTICLIVSIICVICAIYWLINMLMGEKDTLAPFLRSTTFALLLFCLATDKLKI